MTLALWSPVRAVKSQIEASRSELRDLKLADGHPILKPEASLPLAAVPEWSDRKRKRSQPALVSSRYLKVPLVAGADTCTLG
jgi:hypothetical protein